MSTNDFFEQKQVEQIRFFYANGKEKELEQEIAKFNFYLNVFKKPNVSRQDFTDTTLDMLNFANMNDMEFEYLPLAYRVGFALTNKRMILLSEKFGKKEWKASENDYVLLWDRNDDYTKYVDLPKMTQKEARYINNNHEIIKTIKGKPKKTKSHYWVIPRVYAEKHYKKAEDRYDLISFLLLFYKSHLEKLYKELAQQKNATTKKVFEKMIENYQKRLIPIKQFQNKKNR